MSTHRSAAPQRRHATEAGAVDGAVKAFLIVFILLCSGLLLGASLAPAASLARNVVVGMEEGLFDYEPLRDDLGEPWQRSVILDREGEELAVLRDENRTLIDIDDVPAHVIEAVLATEDHQFYEHAGVNWTAITRAAVANITAGEITAGGSTITQQLVKLAVLDDAQTLDRKVQEAIYATELEQRLTKDEILEAYLNEAFFGNRTYGLATAAEFYWGKDVSELTVPEAATLAGIIRAPSRNDPVANPDNARARRDIVLGQMANAGFIGEEEAAAYRQEELALDVHPLEEPDEPHFVNYVRQQLLDDPALGEDRETRELLLRRGGLEIHTTLHPELQELAQDVIVDLLDRDEDPLGALAALDHRTGEVLALGVGPKEFGSEEDQLQVNLAARGGGGSSRDAGSAFKPFMLAAALDSGLSRGYTFEGGREYEFENLGCAPDYRPSNFGDAAHGEMDMAEATTRSSNVYFAHLLDEVGMEPLVEAIERGGIPVSDRDYLIDGPICSLVLGAAAQAGVFPLEMANAFGAFANEGERCERHAVVEVRDRRGESIELERSGCEPAYEPDVANGVTHLLRGPIESGTAARNGQIGRPAAGKTGTTQDSHDAWFVGYVPQLTTAAWVGHEQPRRMEHPACDGGVTGGCLPTMLWRDFMTQAVDILELAPEDFPPPPPLPEGNVPDVVGMQEDDARETLTEADFRPSSEEVEHWAEEGTVVDQSPEGGSEAAEGSVVDLDVSDGSADLPTVPNLIGLTLEEAEEALERAGLEEYDSREVPVDREEEYGVVVDQSPAPGEPAYQDDGMTELGIRLDVGRPMEEGETPVETFPAEAAALLRSAPERRGRRR